MLKRKWLFFSGLVAVAPLALVVSCSQTADNTTNDQNTNNGETNPISNKDELNSAIKTSQDTFIAAIKSDQTKLQPMVEEFTKEIQNAIEQITPDLDNPQNTLDAFQQAITRVIINFAKRILPLVTNGANSSKTFLMNVQKSIQAATFFSAEEKNTLNTQFKTIIDAQDAALKSVTELLSKDNLTQAELLKSFSSASGFDFESLTAAIPTINSILQKHQVNDFFPQDLLTPPTPPTIPPIIPPTIPSLPPTSDEGNPSSGTPSN